MTEETYTHGHHDSVLRSHRWRTAANSAGYLLHLLRPGTTLLDVGCGPGTLTVDLARAVAPGRVVGIDVAADVVDQARDHARAAGAANVELLAGDFRVADLAGRRFDVAHAHQVLQHLRDPVGALAAMAELVRPGGAVAVRDADYPAMVWVPGDARLDRWREIYIAVTAANGASADAGRRLLGWAHDAGLHDARYTTSTWTFATPDDRAWWGSLWAERSVSSAFAEQAVRYGVATAGELADVAGGWGDWAAQPASIFTVVHGEVLATVTH